ncbi:MAG: 30S ribosomal protein S5 alanine N-acetyltransferase [Rhodospirillaceae bacterium]|nr:30S ribosomal protein S5 alanine N-acetyltransferase [Rhodospirillaceae bacterium]|tara:strand:- start:589 stop:1200 length:612 start_codon:yes stop_codon:yes gene_type:complete
MRLFRSLSGNAGSNRLEGRRTFLRAPVERDWAAYADLRAASRNFLEPWEPTWPPDALSRDAFFRRLNRYTSDWRDDKGYSMFVFERESAALLGGISVSNVRRGVAQTGTLGYWIGEAHAGQGYMREGLDLLLGFCFTDLGLHRVEAACLPSNAASQRLLLASGFSEDGFARKYLKIRGVWQDHLLFSLLAEDHQPTTLYRLDK